MHGRKRPFSIVFDPFHIDRITAVFYRIVLECKRSNIAFSHRIRSFSTVYDTVKYGPYETGQIRAVRGHKRQYTRRISAYMVTVFMDLGTVVFWTKRPFTTTRIAECRHKRLSSTRYSELQVDRSERNIIVHGNDEILRFPFAGLAPEIRLKRTGYQSKLNVSRRNRIRTLRTAARDLTEKTSFLRDDSIKNSIFLINTRTSKKSIVMI